MKKLIYERKAMDVADFIAVYAAAHGGNSPTLAEIGAHFRINVRAAKFHLDVLEENGLAARIDGKLVLAQAGYRRPRWIPKRRHSKT